MPLVWVLPLFDKSPRCCIIGLTTLMEIRLIQPQPSANPELKPQRDALGLFLPGNTIGVGQSPGRPKNWWYELIDKVVTPERWEKILERATKAALNGDVMARKFLADQRHGLPTQRIEANVTGAVSVVVERKVPRPADIKEKSNAT